MIYIKIRFAEVYAGIMDTLVVRTDFCDDPRLLPAVLPKIIDSEKDNLLQFLSAIDTGIKDIGYDDRSLEYREIIRQPQSAERH